MVAETPKTAMPIAAGILNIISGAFKLIGFLALILVGLFMAVSPGQEYPFNPAAILVLISIFLFALGILSVVGGIFALQRRNFGLSLAGSIASFLPFNLLGMASIILVAMASKEFKP
jgi:hypothetical protein